MPRRIVPTTAVIGRRGPEGPASTVPGPEGDVTPEALAALNGAEDARDAAQGAANAASTSAGQAAGSAGAAAQSAADAATSAQQAANGAVRSINTKTPDAGGAVTLSASDIGAATPANITSASTADRDRANHTGTQAATTITGLGTAATKDTGTASGNIPLLGTGGRLDVARLGSGTASASTFLRGDGSFAAPPASGGRLARTSRAGGQGTTYDVSSNGAFAELDPTNLSITLTFPASGKAKITIEGGMIGGSSSGTQVIFALTDTNSTLVAGTARAVKTIASSPSQDGYGAYSAEVSGTAGTTKTYRMAWRLMGAGGASLQYGGGNGESSGYWYGPIVMEAWTV